MKPDKVAAAAERLQRVKGGEGLSAVYDRHGDMPGRELDKWIIDKSVVADAYLSQREAVGRLVKAALNIDQNWLPHYCAKELAHALADMPAHYREESK